jgi:hypothetical protein
VDSVNSFNSFNSVNSVIAVFSASSLDAADWICAVESTETTEEVKSSVLLCLCVSVVDRIFPPGRIDAATEHAPGAVSDLLS